MKMEEKHVDEPDEFNQIRQVEKEAKKIEDEAIVQKTQSIENAKEEIAVKLAKQKEKIDDEMLYSCDDDLGGYRVYGVCYSASIKSQSNGITSTSLILDKNPVLIIFIINCWKLNCLIPKLLPPGKKKTIQHPCES